MTIVFCFVGISMLALSSVQGYHGYVLFAWMYGLCLGGFLYTIKMLTMERVRGRHFAKVWGKRLSSRKKLFVSLKTMRRVVCKKFRSCY